MRLSRAQGIPLVLPPPMTPGEVQTALKILRTYLGGLRWASGGPWAGVPTVHDFADQLSDPLSEIECGYVQIQASLRPEARPDPLLLASEDLSAGQPFSLIFRIEHDGNLLHVIRMIPLLGDGMAEAQRMLAYLTDKERADLFRATRGPITEAWEGRGDVGSRQDAVDAVMVTTTRIAHIRGYVIPGAGCDPERWFRAYGRPLVPAKDLASTSLHPLPIGIANAVSAWEEP